MPTLRALFSAATAATALGTIALGAPHVTEAANIVLVHGLLGFGPKELWGMNYWGWTGNWPNQNYTHELSAGGRHAVFYAVVGKVSSNWDRMCELYAQIKGTRTDYGYFHALHNNHSRWGPDYSGGGFLPAWSAAHPIQLVGHSMGPATSLFLNHYLREGAPSELAPYPAGEPPVSPLFQGGHVGWVTAVHSVSGVFNGSPLATGVGPTILDIATAFLTLATQLAPHIPGESGVYNFGLDQYAFPQQVPNESPLQYLERVGNADLAVYFSEHYNDTALHDLTPAGCAAFNSIAKYAYPDVYYFSFSTSRTSAMMTPAMKPFYAVIATIADNPEHCKTQLTCNAAVEWCQVGAPPTPVPYCVDATWEANDGLVPARSSLSPEIGVPAAAYIPAVPRNASMNAWVPGTWYTTHVERDHLQVVGADFNDGRPATFFGTHPYEVADGNTFLQILEQVDYVERQTAPGATSPPPTVAAAYVQTAYPTMGTLAPTTPTVATPMPTLEPTLTLAGYALLSTQPPSPTVAAVPVSSPSSLPPSPPSSPSTASEAATLPIGAQAGIGAGVAVVAVVGALAAVGFWRRASNRGGDEVRDVDVEGRTVRTPRHMSRHGNLGLVPASTAFASSRASTEAARNPVFGGYA